MTELTRAEQKRNSLAVLAQTRAEIRAYFTEPEDAPPKFPRSATMRFLVDRDRLTRVAINTLGFVAVRTGLPSLLRLRNASQWALRLGKLLKG